jgi:dihydroflavonol-4-reductase
MERGRVGESYILAGERASYGDVLRIVAEVAGRRGPVLLPDGVVRAFAAATAPLERWVRVPQPLTAEAGRSGTATYFGDNGKAAAELGWTSRPLREGLTETVLRETSAAS